MQISAIIAASILAFARAKPVPQQGVDYSTIDYSNDGVDYSTIDYSNDGVDYSTIDYSNNGVDYKTINYNVAAATTTQAIKTSSSSTVTTSAVSTISAVTGIASAFSLMSTHSGNVNIHLQPIYAAGSVLKLGGKAPQSYTPPNVDVPLANRTTFSASNNALFLRVVVPGGQGVYTTTNGTLGYTVPHSGGIPTGATRDGFSLSSGSSLTTLLYNGKRDFVACPNGDGTYDVVVAAKSTRTDCLGIDLIAANATNIAAGWQW